MVQVKGMSAITKQPTPDADPVRDGAAAKVSLSAAELVDVNRTLSEINAELERRVRERTSQLVEANRLLRLKEQTLRLAQHSGGAGTWDWEIASGRLTWSDCYGSIDCLDEASTPETYSGWLETLYPEDREQVERQLS
jgi:hypothetical protein